MGVLSKNKDSFFTGWCPKDQWLTVFLHVHLEALLEPTRLTLIASGHVDDAVATLLAHVVQVPSKRVSNTGSSSLDRSHALEKLNHIKDGHSGHCGTYLRMLRLKNPRHPSQLGTPVTERTTVMDRQKKSSEFLRSCHDTRTPSTDTCRSVGRSPCHRKLDTSALVSDSRPDCRTTNRLECDRRRTWSPSFRGDPYRLTSSRRRRRFLSRGLPNDSRVQPVRRRRTVGLKCCNFVNDDSIW